jgi:polysaccharide pyruvyl transferase WcaK-like protein
LKQLAILGWYGSPNLGDEAELAAILAACARLPQPPRVVAFSVHPARTLAQHGGYPGGLRALPRNPFAPATLRALRASAAIVLGGGGLIQDQTSIYNLPLFTLFALVAAGLRRPLQWWGVGVEPLVTPLGRAQARLLVRLAAPGAVGLRDENSRRLLRRAGVPPRALRVSADPAVSIRPAPPAEVAALLPADAGESGRPWVAFCLRDLPNNPRGVGPGYLLPVALQKRLGLGGGDRAAHARRAAAFYALLARAADHLIGEHGARVLFVPFWPGRDDAIAAAIRTQMRHPEAAVLLGAPLSPAQARALLGAMDLVVAMRLHALIFAATAGVPVLGFGYAQKVPAFLARIGQGARALDPATLTWPQLQAALDAVWVARDAIRAALPSEVARLQGAAAADAAVATRLLGAA